MKWTIYCLLLLQLQACTSKPSAPDVSKIPVKLELLRFEDAFFGLDTNHLEEALNEIDRKYPGFAKDFLFNIMGTTPTTAVKDIKSFSNSYRMMYDSAKISFAKLEPIAQEVETGLKYVKYYFPNYAVPKNWSLLLVPSIVMAISLPRMHSLWDCRCIWAKLFALSNRNGPATLSRLYFKKIRARLYAGQLHQKYHR